jgi:ABC-type uncharacterized transport system auxiliary subunit
MRYILIVSLAILCGCSLFSPLPPSGIHKYQLNNSSTHQVCNQHLYHGTLQISSVQASSPFDVNSMLYSYNQQEVLEYTSHIWINSFDQLLTQQILLQLSDSCLYDNVVSGEFITYSNYRLNTKLISVMQVIDKQSVFKLEALVQLVNNADSKILKSKLFDIHVDVASDVNGYVVGANQATSLFMQELLFWLKN